MGCKKNVFTAQTDYYKRIIITKIMIYLRDDNSFFV